VKVFYKKNENFSFLKLTTTIDKIADSLKNIKSGYVFKELLHEDEAIDIIDINYFYQGLTVHIVIHYAIIRF